MLGAHRHVFHRITAEIDHALPAYVQAVRDEEYDDLHGCVRSSWENADWSDITYRFERFAYYCFDHGYLGDVSNIDTLAMWARRMWMLAAHDIDGVDASLWQALGSQEVLDELSHIVKSQKRLTMKFRIRLLRCVSYVLHSIVHVLPSIWEVDNHNCRDEMERRFNFITIDVLLKLFEYYIAEQPVCTSSTVRKFWISAVVRIAGCMRRLWVYRDDVGIDLVYKVIGDVDNLDLRSKEIFFKFRLILLMCPSVTLYRFLMDGTLFKWWNLVPEGTVNSWNSMMLLLIVRAIKFAWAAGKPYLTDDITTNLPSIFHIFSSSLSIPNSGNANRSRESIPGEYTVLLLHPLYSSKLFGQLLAYLVCSINEQGVPVVPFATEIMDYLSSAVSVMYPYTHPSNGGKWSSNIANFVKHFVLTYTVRVGRERGSPQITASTVGTVNGDTRYRLTRANDVAVVDLFYSMARQGIYCKNLTLAPYYEDAIKRLCTLLPDRTLSELVDHLIMSTETLTEPHRILSCMRIFGQLMPTILAYTPIALLPILDACVKGIDAADLFKTGQALTLVNIIFSHMPCRDLSDIELTHQAKVDLIRSVYMRVSAETSGDVDMTGQGTPVQCTAVDLHNSVFDVASPLVAPNSEDNFFSREFVVLRTTKNMDEAVAALDHVLSQRKCISQNLPGWCQDWFEAVLRLSENSSRPDADRESMMNAVEMGTFVLLRSALATILSQTDAHTFGCICETFVRWVCDNAFRENALKYMVAIATAISHSNSKMAMEMVFDKLFERFSREVENSYAVLSEDQLAWYIGCFSGLVRRANVELLPRLPKLRYILKAGLSHASKKVFKGASKLLQRCVESLVGVYFTDVKCANNFKDDLCRGLLLWDVPWFARDAEFVNGRCDITGTLGVKWHIATAQEMDCAVDLCWCFVDLMMRLTEGTVDMAVPTKPIGAVPLEMDIDPSCTLYVRMNRACMLAKRLLRSLSQFSVDDRPVRAKGLLTVTPIDRPEITEVQQFVLQFILTVLSKFGGIESTNDLVVANIYTKLLKTAGEYMCRCVQQNDSNSFENVSVVASMKNECYIGTTVTAARAMLSWTSSYHGFHKEGHWQDAPRVAWLLMVYERFHYRLNLRKLDHECVGPRKELLNMILQCATSQFKDLAHHGRNMIKPLINLHRRVRSHVAHFVLNQGIAVYPTSADGSDRAIKTLTNISDSLILSLLKHIGSSDIAFDKFCRFICPAVMTVPNKDSLMVKFDNRLVDVLKNREVMPPTETTAGTMNFILDSLLDSNSKQVAAASHWRFQLYATSLLVCFNDLIPVDSRGRYIAWLMEAVDRTVKQPCVVTVALHGIYRLLGDPANRGSLPAELFEYKFAETLMRAICVANHEDLTDDNTATLVRVNKIVTSVIKLDRTWPRNRMAANSGSFSLHNFYLMYWYFSAMLDAGKVDTIEQCKEVLAGLASCPPIMRDDHCAFAEITAALMKASLRAERSVRERIWEVLHPVIKIDLETIVQDRIVDFMDGLRLALEDYDIYGDACIPIINVGINFRAPLKMDALQACDLASDNTTSPRIVKQLKLYRALLQQLTTKHRGIFEILCDAILKEDVICNSPLQIVEEVGYLCSFMAGLCRMYGELHEFKQSVHSHISQLVARVDANGSAEGTDDMPIKGLLSVISMLYSASVPVQDLSHPYTGQFLSFCLKHRNHSNTVVGDFATRAVSQIALSPFHHQKDLSTVDAVVSILDNVCKAQSYNTKEYAINVAKKLQRNMCMYLRRTNAVKVLLEMYISALQHRQARDAARDALTYIVLSSGDHLYIELTERFYSLIKENHDETASAGVFGLAALIGTAPYHVPKWMPYTLTRLASCGASRFPDIVRRVVQTTLQDFFKSHMDAWYQVHVHKFTPEQLDVLEMYKGCPACAIFTASNCVDRIADHVDSMDIRRPPKPIFTPNDFLAGYSIVYRLCTAKNSRNEEPLYRRVSQLFVDFINRKVALIVAEKDVSQIPVSAEAPATVEQIVDTWARFRVYAEAVGRLFSYLDRFYVNYSSSSPVKLIALEAFQRIVFEKHKERLKRRLLELLDTRRSETDVDEFEVGALAQMFHELDGSGGLQYKNELESEIIARAARYYSTMGPLWVQDCDLLDYLSIVDHCLEQERADCARWLSETTLRPLTDTVLKALIQDRQSDIIQKVGEIDSLIDQGSEADLQLMYRIITPIQGGVPAIAESLNRSIRRSLSSTVSFDEVLSGWLRKRAELLKSCFVKNDTPTASGSGENAASSATTADQENASSSPADPAVDPAISNAVRRAFGNVIAQLTDFTKDLVDHWDSTLVSADPGSVTRLRNCCGLLEALHHRDDFYQCYKFKLAGRLLYCRSSLNMERTSIHMLQGLGASDEVERLRRMIDESSEARKCGTPFMVISKFNWPCLRDYSEDVKLHSTFEDGFSKLKEMQRAHLHRTISHNRMLGRVELELECGGATRTLICDLVQASALMLFEGPSLALDDIAAKLGVNRSFALQILQPLFDKGVLSLQAGDEVELNSAFNDGCDVTLDAVPSYRDLRSNSASAETSAGSALDPDAAIDASIVALLKAMKSMKRDELLLQLPRFSRENVLARLQSLRERDYITISDDTIAYAP
ncbi:Cullin, putative [Babesia bigemina]|uniref:Cullin, putative n=1 Tax=Babesia bigemina TaxID=5866 RepID=A0A061DA48_BABBI|nr:Cullin, putative [Babesia bigemina]CDR96817.1 Cullin, putative [Babesia bigemina]|eukprot:XP_012769003.1 Cullin, putative [Babesia bigemina]